MAVGESLVAGSSTQSGAKTGRDWALYVLCGVFIFWCAVFIARTSFRIGGGLHFTLFDDAMVSMRYARNFAEGNGLAWNPGDAPVEGFSNPLWTGWMAIIHLLPVSDAKTSFLVMLSSALCLVANLIVVHRIALRLDMSRVPALLAVAMTAVFYPLSYWALRGMEVGLLAFLIDLGILIALGLREQFTRTGLIWLCVALAACVMVRMDAIIAGGLIAVFAWRFTRKWQVLAATGGTIVAVLTGMTLARLVYYGDALPNTYYLKTTGVSMGQRFEAGLHSLRVLIPGRRLGATLVLVVALAIVSLWPRSGQLDGSRLMLASIFIGQLAYSFCVGGDAWEYMGYANRYISIAAPALLILAADGIGRVVDRGARSPSAPGLPRSKAIVAMLAIAFLLAVTANGSALGAWYTDNAELAMADAYGASVGLCERAATRPDATIAVYLAGNGPYYSRRRSIDMLGKSDRHIARLAVPSGIRYRPGHNKADWNYSVAAMQPDIVEASNFAWMRPASPLAEYYWATQNYRLLENGIAVRKTASDVDVDRMAEIRREHSVKKFVPACSQGR